MCQFDGIGFEYKLEIFLSLNNYVVCERLQYRSKIAMCAEGQKAPILSHFFFLSNVVISSETECLTGTDPIGGLVRDSMYRALSYSARLDQPAAGKVLETANGGCLVDQKSGTENYKWSVRGKGMETWPKAFSKYHF